MAKVYIELEAAIEIFEQAFDNNWEVSGTLDRLRAIPAADDVVGVPEWMTKDELLDILRAAREGRLKVTAPPTT